MTNTSERDFPVDIVYLWCNSNDANWIGKKNNELKKYNKPLDNDAVSDCRFISTDELKFSLRSLEKFAPWINKIYIVTDNQIPDWLDTTNSKVKIIDHKEILPEGALPTFNATAIETSLHKIPELSEHFLFANDDMFFGQPVTKDFFFAKDGYPVFRFSKRRIIKKPYRHLYGYMISLAYRLVTKNTGKTFPYFPHHNIDAYRKSSIEECIETFKTGFEKTVYQKFREKECIQRSIYEYYAIAKGQGHPRVIDNYTRRLGAVFTKSGLEALQIPLKQSNLNMIDKFRPHLFCLNDGLKTTDNDRLAMHMKLEKIFPEPSSFEKHSVKKTDIYACYHKPFDIIQSDIIKPVQVGAELTDTDFLKLKDNTGDNISAKNPYFCELTALYHLWKNSGADYKGIVHYRRFFDLGNGKKRWINKIPANCAQEFCLTQTNIDYLLQNNEVIVPMKRFISQSKTVYSYYEKRHYIKDLDRCLELIKEKYPQMYDNAVNTVKNSNGLYLYNMFIANKEFADEYCAWLFDILFALEKEIQPEVEKRNAFQKRVYGFLAERLFTIYIEYRKTHGLKYIELPVIYCETNPKRYNVFQLRTKIYTVLVKLGIRNPHWQEKYGV